MPTTETKDSVDLDIEIRPFPPGYTGDPVLNAFKRKIIELGLQLPSLQSLSDDLLGGL